MTTQSNPQRIAYPIRSEPTTRLFAIGQAVRLRGGYSVFTARSGDIYRVIGTLPPSGNSLQCRIRNEREQHERVATEDSLEMVRANVPGESGDLADRTFRR
ncbi:hypothetical protein GCM10028812_50590 [Ancylobacter sonchi]